jgi:CBS domain-containing protein
MQARDLMTPEVVSVSPDTPIRDIGVLLLAHHISAVPVVDTAGMVVGMVSEGDLIGRSAADREASRDWWLALVAEGEELNSDYLAHLRSSERTARDVMSAPVVRVTEGTDVFEIAALLAQYRIKRVPVVRDGKIVGIVSRADLLRELAGAEALRHVPPEHVARTRNLLAEALATLDHHFFGGRPHEQTSSPTAREATITQGGASADDFRSLMIGFENRKAEVADAARRAAVERRREKVRELIDEHVQDRNWNDLMHRAREAAERGEGEFQLLRFPSDLCTDRGGAINAALADWPQTLRGEAAEVYLRWEKELKSRDFHLSARVLDFPHGMPGDIGLFLGWGR